MKAQTEGAKIGCFREFQNSIEDSVHSLLTQEIARLGIPGYIVDKSKIYHTSGGGFSFKGLSRSIDAVKSMHGFKYFWVEEAQFLSDNSIKILIPTVREVGSELWFTGNPMGSADPFSQRFIVPFQKELKRDGYYEDDDHLIILMNHRDNPWFPDVLEQDRQRDYRELDRALYDHIWEGAFNDYVEDSIIKAEWFDACIDAHKVLGYKPRGSLVVAHDPSDEGADDKGLAVRYGSVVLDARARSFGDVNEGCDWALDCAIENRADAFVWDCDGLGVSLRRQVNESLNGKQVEALSFRGSNSPDFPEGMYEAPKITGLKDRSKNKDTFRNKRAQYYWMLRDRVHNTYQAVTKNEYKNPDDLISFSSTIPDMQQLRSELCRIPRKYNSNGLIQIMTKQDMKRVLRIESPNIADAVMMSLATPTAALRPDEMGAPEPEYEAAY